MGLAIVTGVKLCCQTPDKINEKPLFSKSQIAALIGDIALVIILTTGSLLTFLAIVGVPMGPLGGISALTLPGGLSLLGGVMLIAVADAIVLMILLAKKAALEQRLLDISHLAPSPKHSNKDKNELVRQSITRSEKRLKTKQETVQKKQEEIEQRELELSKYQLNNIDSNALTQMDNCKQQKLLELSAVKRTLDQLTQEVQTLENTLGKDDAELQKIGNESTRLNQEVQNLTDEFTRMQIQAPQETNRLNLAISTFNAQIEGLRKEIETVKGKIGGRTPNALQMCYNQEVRRATELQNKSNQLDRELGQVEAKNKAAIEEKLRAIQLMKSRTPQSQQEKQKLEEEKIKLEGELKQINSSIARHKALTEEKVKEINEKKKAESKRQPPSVTAPSTPLPPANTTPAVKTRGITNHTIMLYSDERETITNLEKEFFEKRKNQLSQLPLNSRLTYLGSDKKQSKYATASDKLHAQTARALQEGKNEATQLKDFQTTRKVDLTNPPQPGPTAIPWMKNKYGDGEGSWHGSDNVGIAHSRGYRSGVDEDAFASLEIQFGDNQKAELHIVCDGHGDKAIKAKFVATVFPKIIKEKLDAATQLDEGAISDILTSSIVEIDSFLKEIGDFNHREDYHPGGTTLTGVLCIDGKVYTPNVGDSRTALFKKNSEGKIQGFQLTEDADFRNPTFGSSFIDNKIPLIVKDTYDESLPDDQKGYSSVTYSTKEGAENTLFYDQAGTLCMQKASGAAQPVPADLQVRANGTLSVARSIGEQIPGQPKLGQITKGGGADNVSEGKIFYIEGYAIIACDGFWDGISIECAAQLMDEMITAGFTPMQMAARFMQDNLLKQQETSAIDNVTIIVLKLP